MLSCFTDSETLENDPALPDTDGSVDKEPAPISNAARIRQMLSIHSLIRQASFVDDSPVVASAAVSKGKPTIEPSQNEGASSPSAERCRDDLVPDTITGGRTSVDNGPLLQNMDPALSTGLIWRDPFEEEQGCLDSFIESDYQHWKDAWALFDVGQDNDNASLWNPQIS